MYTSKYNTIIYVKFLQMKFALVVLALVATASARKVEIPNLGRGELHKDLQEFLDLVPVDQIVALTLKYMAEDREFQNMIRYFQSEEFRSLVADIEALPEIRKLMDYIHHAGVDIYYLVNKLNDRLKLPRLTPPATFLAENDIQITGGIRGYINDVKALLPLQKFKELYKRKLATSKAFRDFVDQLKSENFQKIVNAVYANPKFQALLAKARKAGVDLILIKDLLETILGIKVPSG